MVTLAKTNERIPRRVLFRRRPPRPPAPLARLGAVVAMLWPLWALLAAAGTVTAQLTTITSPSTTRLSLDSGQSTLLSLTAPATFPLYVSLSLCAIPASLASNGSFVLPTDIAKPLFVSNVSSNAAPGPAADETATGVPKGAKGDSSLLLYGLANVTIGAANDGNVTIGIYAPDTADILAGGDGEWSDSTVRTRNGPTEAWVFELSISNGTADPPYFAEGKIGFRYEDSDATSVLLAATNQSAAYAPLLIPATSLSYSLARSECFLRTAEANNAAVPANVRPSTTSRGYGPGNRTQFLIEGLDRDTLFTAWLLENVTTSDGAVQRRVWDPVFFSTKRTDSCRLVFDVPACPAVAYAVPAPTSLATEDLLSFFNETISASFANFSRTLTTFPCDKNPYGLYSVVSKCSDCADAYRDYLCAATMPRCDDAPASSPLNSTLPDQYGSTGDLLASWALPSSYQTSLLRTDPFASRTPLFGPRNLSTTFPDLFSRSYPPTAENLARETPFPYTEIPPCLDVCNLVQARCPPFLQFVCPKSDGSNPQGGTGPAAWGQTQTVPSTERLANDIFGSSLQKRAADRWGNVFCNALGSDLTMALQFVDPFAKWPYEPPVTERKGPPKIVGGPA
ncbi:hypothetical protein JCM8202_001724 [Rhodotorula sphaerocarpa]